MSAYIVDLDHITYLIGAAMHPKLNQHGSSFSYFWNGERHSLPLGDFGRAAELANVLWQENARSVGYRYPSGSSANLPGPNGGIREITVQDIRNVNSLQTVQVFKAIDCYAYQSCEHKEWAASEAFAFCESLRKEACRATDGYDDAEWGAPERKTRKQR